MVKACRSIEKGRSTLATIRSNAEKEHLKVIQPSINYNWWWVSGVRINPWLHKWFWYLDNGVTQKILPIEKFFWNKDGKQPDRGQQETCIVVNSAKGVLWHDTLCDHHFLGLCEIRC